MTPSVNAMAVVLDHLPVSGIFTPLCGINSAVECQLPKLKVDGSNPLSRST